MFIDDGNVLCARYCVRVQVYLNARAALRSKEDECSVSVYGHLKSMRLVWVTRSEEVGW